MAKSSAKNVGNIRIIGGRWRGRKLAVPHAEGLRPTTDRVRETVFNWLQFELHDARVLDLFAGTGALAFEALSRGAAHALMVEQHAPAARCLSENIKTLNAAGQVLQADALKVLLTPPEAPFDVVFIDPPFRQQLLPQVVSALQQGGWLADNAWIYVETETELNAQWPANWQLHREKQAGQVSYRLFQKRGS
ncbi:16S rRNA m(2)G-966 methyltransferase [Pseudidiomarina planktonica]|uniref:Ribosomal RNA small subunit methyltransferase D n=1 Tax=Pseudidiomarina planktonica TaxID=1323738 RepID=A0A1Y6EF33_9GAMM|nr:16S rRNA (guanine(966)-N(2))-methyltransferase RsmD [Pseudidiomarina planktonica]RUO66233.1 16S rRNA (guanine(966)-N(2))-methyltransferase RsmD [Pseudidiomarina planktonica]SMQ59510.1 16S rRNA m(2)G-966 methyltransferase [Pseudidiomarina planktonica]